MNSNDLPADPADSTIDPGAGVNSPTPDDPAADLATDQEMAYDLMPAPLQEAALEMQRRAREGELALMRERYAIGQKYLQIKGQPEVHGPMSDIQLAEFFGAGVALLKEARRLARRYTPKQFEQILAARNPETGFQITYDHLVALQRVEDDALANEFLLLTLHNSWSPTQLSRAINKKLRQKANPPKAPRPKPVRLPGILMNVAAVTDEWKRQYVEVWDLGYAITDAFKAVPEETIDLALAKRLEELRDQAESAAEAQRSLAVEFERLRAQAEEIVRRRQRGAD